MLAGPATGGSPWPSDFDGFCLFMACRRHPAYLTRLLQPPRLRRVGGRVSHPAGAKSARDGFQPSLLAHGFRKWLSSATSPPPPTQSPARSAP
nr:hypothetical protein SHINE37_60144 [Rhizobiaceae bacterium]